MVVILTFNNYTQHDITLGTIWIPTNLSYGILNTVGVGIFEWAVISKRSFAHKGVCLENMLVLFSQKFQILILSARLYVFFGADQK